jgi:hypothetical protein
VRASGVALVTDERSLSVQAGGVDAAATIDE